MSKLNFQHHYSLNDPSEIIIICQSAALRNIYYYNQLLNIFVETVKRVLAE